MLERSRSLLNWGFILSVFDTLSKGCIKITLRRFGLYNLG